MPAFFRNRIVQFIGGFFLVVIVLFVVLTILASLNSSRSTGLSAPSVGMGRSVNSIAEDFAYDGEAMMAPVMESDYYYPSPIPTGGGYSSELETYETTDYSVSGRSGDFAALCGAIRNIKANPQVHFKSLNESINNCNAIFYVEENLADGIVSQLMDFDGITITRSTQSVTQHKERLESQADIVRQQLASVNRSLAVAETEFDEIAAYAREANDAATLSKAITEKLRLIDTLTARKISLTSQLDSLYKQSAELQERIGVAQFSVNISRSYPIEVGKTSRKWEQAWNDLSDSFTDTLIGITAFFGIFLLWTLRITLYLLIVILIIRGLWKFVRFVWKM